MGFWKTDQRVNRGVHFEDACGVPYDIIIREVNGSLKHPRARIEIRVSGQSKYLELDSTQRPVVITDGLDIIIPGRTSRETFRNQVRICYHT